MTVVMLTYKPVDLIAFGCQQDLRELKQFWFSRREWNSVGHETLLKIAGNVGFAGLCAIEGGFDDNPGGQKYDDARYGRIQPVMSLWKCGMSNHRMWILRLIFRLCDIATFDTEYECIVYVKKECEWVRKISLIDS